MLPGHATFRNMSRYSPYHERTFARWYDPELDWVSLNKSAITAVVPSEHDQALVLDASFVPKSGKHTYGLDRFWNSSHSRTEKGLEISTLAWLDLTGNCAYCLSVEQTPPSANASDPETSRMDVYLDQLRRVVQTHDLNFLRYVVSDGAYSKQKFVAGVLDLGMHQIGKLRADVNLHYLYQGPRRPGRGHQKTSMAKCTSMNYHALNVSILKMNTSYCIIRFSTMYSCNVTSRWWSWYISNITGMRFSLARMWTWSL